MGRLIDADEVKKQYPIMENDFGMVVNERLHKNLDKIPTVEAIPKDQYEAKLKADMVAIFDKIRAEIEAYQSDAFYPDNVMMNKRMVLEIIDKYRKGE